MNKISTSLSKKLEECNSRLSSNKVNRWWLEMKMRECKKLSKMVEILMYHRIKPSKLLIQFTKKTMILINCINLSRLVNKTDNKT